MFATYPIIVHLLFLILLILPLKTIYITYITEKYSLVLPPLVYLHLCMWYTIKNLKKNTSQNFRHVWLTHSTVQYITYLQNTLQLLPWQGYFTQPWCEDSRKQSIYPCRVVVDLSAHSAMALPVLIYT